MGAVRRAKVQDLVALANAGALPKDLTALGVAVLLAKEVSVGASVPPVQMSQPVALFAVEAPAEKRDGDALSEVPEWIEVIPAPRPGASHVETRDWRAGFTVDAQEIVDAFYSEPEERRAKPIDWEHLGHRNWRSERNPAAGWIEDVKVGDDGVSVWARVEWTDIGRDEVLNKRYRYISPVVAIQWPLDNEGNIDWDGVPKATKLIDAALTNNPATYIRDLARTPTGDSDEMENSAGAGALAASFAPVPTGGREDEGDVKISKEMLSALGLSEDATQEQFEAAVLAKAAKGPEAEASKPQPAPTVDHEALVQSFAKLVEEQLTPLRDKVEALESSETKTKAEVRDAQLNSILDNGVRAFKVTPGSRDALLEMGRSVGPDKLREYVDSLPTLEHLSQPAGKGATNESKRDDGNLTAVELDVAEKVGLSPDEMRKSKAVLTKDGGRFSAGFVSMISRPKDDEEDSEVA